MKFGFFKSKQKKKKKEQGIAAQNWRDTNESLNQTHDLKGRFCPNPFEQLDVYTDGKAYSCCSGWLRLPLGDLNVDSAEGIWNSKASQAIRASIHDGSFRYCDHKLCPRIQGNNLPTVEAAKHKASLKPLIENQVTELETNPVFINFCNDDSCNLSCPSCRVSAIRHSSGPVYDNRKAIHEKLVKAYMGNPSKQELSINVTGAGDPFGSKIFREFLFDLNGDDFPNMKVNLQTNGVMFTEKNWNKIHKIHNNLNNVIISLDAACAETYAITRRGGNWDLLQTNLHYLAEKRQQGLFNRLRMDYVVQVDNYKEMPNFIALARHYNADQIYFSMVTDWGTWPQEVYASKCIWKEGHPQFSDFIDTLKHDNFGLPNVDLGNLTAYRHKALAAA